jgi:translation initiation factor IF-1
MSKGDHLELDGTIEEAMGGGQYRVRLDDAKESTHVRARLCGKMKQRHIQVIPGDKVKVGVSPYDTSHGLITWRHR